MVDAHSGFSIGDVVTVPWGLSEVDAEVLEIQQTGLGTRLVVRLMGADDLQGEVLTLPADSVHRADLQEYETPTPDRRRYEESLRNALTTMFPRSEIKAQRPSGHDVRADMEIKINDKLIFVEAKVRSPYHKITSDDVVALSGLASKKTPVVLVSNQPMTKDARHRLRSFRDHGRPISFVLWRTSQDDTKLRAELFRAAGGQNHRH